jgi:NAD(P)-dependent dehydrogenase (short-subunit alcohol dehydrogenase family)
VRGEGQGRFRMGGGYALKRKQAAPFSPTMSFEGQVAIITGGAQGIGYGVAEYLGSRGAAICILDLDAARNDAAVASLAAKGVKASHAVADVSNAGHWEAALAQFLAAHGHIEILIQAAGVTGKTGINTEEVDPDNFDFVQRVNVRGIFLGCRAVLPVFKAAGYGRILNIGSVAGKDGNAGMVAYSASKGAVIAMTKAIGKEYAETGVTCNALAPAVVRTAMVDAMPEQQVKYMTGALGGVGWGERGRRGDGGRGGWGYRVARPPCLSLPNCHPNHHLPAAADKIPMKRCGTIAEIAALSAFIVSRECSFTTGFCFDATGGRCVARARARPRAHSARPLLTHTSTLAPPPQRHLLKRGGVVVEKKAKKSSNLYTPL